MEASMAPESRDLLETIWTTRSVRRFKPDPIPDDVLQALLDAAIRAPNGSNNQTWRILVIRDPELRRQVGEQYGLAYQAYNPDPGARLANEPDPNRQVLVRSSQHLAASMGTERPGADPALPDRPGQLEQPAQPRRFGLPVRPEPAVGGPRLRHRGLPDHDPPAP